MRDPICKCGKKMHLLGELGSFHWECEEGHIRVMRGSDKQRILEYQLRESNRTEEELRKILRMKPKKKYEDILKRIKMMKQILKEADEEFKRVKYAYGRPGELDDWCDIKDKAIKLTKDTFAEIPHEKEKDLDGYFMHRIVGDYLIFAQVSGGGGRSMMGTYDSIREYIAVHLQTGKIREEGFEYKREPYGWWFDLLKNDDGTCSEDEWKKKIVDDAHRRLFDRILNKKGGR